MENRYVSAGRPNTRRVHPFASDSLKKEMKKERKEKLKIRKDTDEGEARVEEGISGIARLTTVVPLQSIIRSGSVYDSQSQRKTEGIL
jgi:hypothetical protein